MLGEAKARHQRRHSRPTEKPMIAGWCLHADTPLTVDEELRAMANRETVLAIVALIGEEGFIRLAQEPLPCPIHTPDRG
jgi:hypothetical protein